MRRSRLATATPLRRTHLAERPLSTRVGFGGESVGALLSGAKVCAAMQMLRPGESVTLHDEACRWTLACAGVGEVRVRYVGRAPRTGGGTPQVSEPSNPGPMCTKEAEEGYPGRSHAGATGCAIAMGGGGCWSTPTMGGGCWGTPIAMGCCSGVTAADCSKLGYRLGYWLEYWLDAATPFVSIAHRNLLGFLHCDDRRSSC
jgi:hypothetical protein